jgi:hypothetical protein
LIHGLERTAPGGALSEALAKIHGVIPAKAGIQCFPERRGRGPELDSRLRGNDVVFLEGDEQGQRLRQEGT